jgi:hypothetical protein
MDKCPVCMQAEMIWVPIGCKQTYQIDCSQIGMYCGQCPVNLATTHVIWTGLMRRLMRIEYVRDWAGHRDTSFRHWWMDKCPVCMQAEMIRCQLVVNKHIK